MQGSEAANVLREDKTFIILSKPLEPAAPAGGAASSPTKGAAAPADLSAASTPERTKLAEGTTTTPAPLQEAEPREASPAAAMPAFDPTFGQVSHICAAASSLPCLRFADRLRAVPSQAAAAEKPDGSPAAAALLRELISTGVIPAGLGRETEVRTRIH